MNSIIENVRSYTCDVCGDDNSAEIGGAWDQGHDVCSPCIIRLAEWYSSAAGCNLDHIFGIGSKDKSATSTNRKKLPKSIVKLVFERDEYRCIMCGSHKDLECDHIVPLKLGGGDDNRNLQTLCKPCNVSKGAKTMREWAGRKS